MSFTIPNSGTTAVTIASNNIAGVTGSKQIGPLVLYNSNAVIEVLDGTLADTTNVTITVPTGAVGVIIVSSGLVAIKGVSGDSGVEVNGITNSGAYGASVNSWSAALALFSSTFVLYNPNAGSITYELTFF